MGVDLTLLMVDGDYGDASGKRTICSWNMLEAPRNYELYGRIEELPRVEIPHSDFFTYKGRVQCGEMKGECCYGDTQEDAYGRPIQFVDSKQLAEVMDDDNGNQAPIKAYLSLIDKSVGLFWH